eukprot:CAMPEP_0115551406 /NCGR_PEP_ID=MMETSP0271-20121206/95715_1 /TAXON_ID=71861 /ORGANISM="Scrippsiella trochoidea, Strain CCMP3099" /LENGTH=168 /DNA_ID=CAMNT_0002985007 /DNA_START=143 /DNA_END=650 /DNA_ORIENTATION=-
MKRRLVPHLVLSRKLVELIYALDLDLIAIGEESVFEHVTEECVLGVEQHVVAEVSAAAIFNFNTSCKCHPDGEYTFVLHDRLHQNDGFAHVALEGGYHNRWPGQRRRRTCRANFEAKFPAAGALRLAMLLAHDRCSVRPFVLVALLALSAAALGAATIPAPPRATLDV